MRALLARLNDFERFFHGTTELFLDEHKALLDKRFDFSHAFGGGAGRHLRELNGLKTLKCPAMNRRGSDLVKAMREIPLGFRQWALIVVQHRVLVAFLLASALLIALFLLNCLELRQELGAVELCSQRFQLSGLLVVRNV